MKTKKKESVNERKRTILKIIHKNGEVRGTFLFLANQTEEVRSEIGK